MNRRRLFEVSITGSLACLMLPALLTAAGCGGGSDSGGGGGTTTTPTSGSRAFNGSYDGFVAFANTSIAASATPITVNLLDSHGSGVRVDGAIVPQSVSAASGLQSMTVLLAGSHLVQGNFPAGTKARVNGVDVGLSTTGDLQQNVVYKGTLVTMTLPPCTIGPWTVANSVVINFNGTNLPFSFTGSVPAVPSNFEETKSTLSVTYGGTKSSSVAIYNDGVYGFSTESIPQTVLSNPQTISLHSFSDGTTVQNLYLGW